MEIGGPLKYILTQEHPTNNEVRSWLISEETEVDREFGLDVVEGTKFTISFVQADTVAVAYESKGCNDHDKKQQVFVHKFAGWNGYLPAGRFASSKTPKSFKIVQNKNDVNLLLARSQSFFNALTLAAPEGTCIENSKRKIHVEFDEI